MATTKKPKTNDARNAAPNIGSDGQLEAIHRVMAVIEFDLDGKILTANENFLATVGYSLDEIKGRHHRMFVDPAYGASPEYKAFWSALNRGEYAAGEYCRYGKGGAEVWIQASYNPILDENGDPFKVVKFATNITDQKRETADFQGQIDAVNKAMAVIEFDLDGTIRHANENFTATVGYDLHEIVGQHHRMFVDPEYGRSKSYANFWAKLNRGEYSAGEYKRFGKDGKEIWIQASYNPIMDANGRPFKVVKYATNITDQKREQADYTGQIAAVNKAMAVIEFDLDGTIRHANENFTATVGYDLREIVGKHHSIFVDPSYGNSDEYRAFWSQLRRGKYSAGEYKRIGKNGEEIWIQASYNPIMDSEGRPFKVVKYATNITDQKRQTADFQGQIDAVNKAMAVIEFNLDGTIRSANENFTATVGYSLNEIVGKHHRMFVEPSYGKSAEYAEFWAKLNRGEYESAEYKRFGKGGKEVWIQASYNPIMDAEGRPFKVVKYATDITRTMQTRAEVEQVSGALGTASGSLNEVASRLSAAAENSIAQTTAAAEEGARVDKSMHNVAGAVEEMVSSISEISNNASKAANIASSAVGVAEDANTTITQLGESSAQIGDVIKVITSIAQQTNLLALNATIEAARAGEAGKGFAVVANEVKELAKETATATEDISRKIEAIHADTDKAVGAITEISDIITNISEIATVIAGAVEEQSITSSEISRSVTEVVDMAGNITGAIRNLADSAENSRNDADSTSTSAAELAKHASRLDELMQNS